MAEYKVLAKGLPVTCDLETLKDYFSSCGEVVHANIVYSKDSGRSKGFGFVTFSNEESMKKALDMNGQEMNGQKIQVLKKINKEEQNNKREQRKRERSRDAESRHVRRYDNSNKLIVLQLPWKCTKDDLQSLFEKFGKIVHCNVLVDKDTGLSRGMGIVKFETEEAFKTAMEEMKDYEYEGRKLAVRKYGVHEQE